MIPDLGGFKPEFNLTWIFGNQEDLRLPKIDSSPRFAFTTSSQMPIR